MKTTRTVETIRDAARAELAALRAASRRLRALAREVERTPEYQRRLELMDDEDDENPPAELFELDRVFGLSSALSPDLVDGETDLETFVAELDRATEPKAWRTGPRRSRAQHVRRMAERKALEAPGDATSDQGTAAPEGARSVRQLLGAAQLLDAATVQAPRDLAGCGENHPRAREISDAATEVGRAMRAATAVLDRIC